MWVRSGRCAVEGTLHYSIAFPPGYATSGKRYPVIYFLHGLPAGVMDRRPLPHDPGALGARDHRRVRQGYDATLIAFHHPETYQVIESWSGYFVLTTPEGKPKDLGSAEANADASAHAHVPQLEDEFRPYG